MHGVAMVFFVLIPAVPAILGNFVLPLMLGAKDVAFPKINLISWYVFRHRHAVDARRHGHRRRRHRLDVLPAVQHRTRRTRNVILTGIGVFIDRVLVDPDRPQLHGDDPPDARAGADLVPAAAVRLGALRHQPGADPRHAGHRHHRADARARARRSASASSTRRSAATRCSSSTSSGSTRTRRSTS